MSNLKLRLDHAKETAIVPSPPSDNGWKPQDHFYRSALKALAWSAGITIVGVGGWLGYQYFVHRPPDPIEVAVHRVKQGDVEITVTGSGTMTWGGEQTLKSPENEATVEQILVNVRDPVKKGQPLVVLRNRQIEEKVRNQQVENQKHQLDLARRREKVAEAQSKLTTAQARYQESQTLLDQGYISEDDLQTDQDAVDQALSALKDAVVEERKAELDVQNGRETLNLLQQQLRDRVITAPLDGVVLQVYVNAGDAIATDTKLLTLGDPNQEIVALKLTTLDAAKVNLNQTARVREIGPDPQIYLGRLVDISPQVTLPDQSSGSSEESGRVDAQVLLNQPSRRLIPGSSVSVEILVDQRHNVVVVPTEVIQWAEPTPFVWMQDDRGKAQKHKIVLGLEGLQQVEVTSGLAAEDEVVLVPPGVTLTPGTPLVIQSDGHNRSSQS
jgi:HlyD family secretion protein